MSLCENHSFTLISSFPFVQCVLISSEMIIASVTMLLEFKDCRKLILKVEHQLNIAHYY